jgi:hypothetical protein
VLTGMATWSGGAGGPTVGPTGPRAARGPGAPLVPAHEEKGIIRRAVHDNHGRRMKDRGRPLEGVNGSRIKLFCKN